MRNRKREQRLIRVITLLDGAELGHDRERIMNLVHSARRASRDGCSVVACQLCDEAFRALNAVKDRLQASGSAVETTEPVASAIDLLPDCMTEERSIYPGFVAERPVAGLAGMIFLSVIAGLLYGVWCLLSAQ